MYGASKICFMLLLKEMSFMTVNVTIEGLGHDLN